jgi:hypothetical protein
MGLFPNAIVQRGAFGFANLVSDKALRWIGRLLMMVISMMMMTMMMMSRPRDCQAAVEPKRCAGDCRR